MTEEEIAVRMEGHEHEIRSLKHRVGELERESETIQSLTVSINKMAVSMEHMLAEQRKQGTRLEALEKLPLETNRAVRNAIITALTGGIVGAVLTAVMTIL